jgi:hypothetical protein
MKATQLPPLVSPLLAFDKCIEASDAITASSSASQMDSILQARRDAGTGLPDCSLLVSPDGDLLLVPTGNGNSSSCSSSNHGGGGGDHRSNQPHAMFRKAPVRTSSTNNNTSTTTNSPQEDTETTPDRSALVEPTDNDAANPHERNAHDEEDQEADSDVGLNEIDNHCGFSELMRQSKKDYESAMFLGNDMYGGDKAMNGFSAKGWSIAATTLAVAQTGHSLAALAHFCEQMVLSRKELAARTTIACDNLRASTTIMNDGSIGSGLEEQRAAIGTNCGTALTAEQWEILDPRATDFEWTVARTGPFLSSTSTLAAAAAAVEQYHFTAAEKESQRWREASLLRTGVLPAMHTATDLFYQRSAQRGKALEETAHRAQVMEELLRKLKQQSVAAWNAVYKAEGRVTLRLEELMAERSRERQQARLRLLQEQNQQQQSSPEDCAMTLASTLSDEVWDMVSSVAESMDHGSFEPVLGHPPDATSTLSDEASTSSSVRHADDTRDETASAAAPTPPPPLPPIDREKIEQEVGLPELRAAAMQVDEEIQEASDTLLNILTTLDTTRRSARLAAETNLVSAANAQAACLRSLLTLERESLQERLRDLEGLEEVLDKIDVRADLDAYIAADKKERGGSSYLGDDDDGGIASALAILSSHVDGSTGLDSHSGAGYRDRSSSEAIDANDELHGTSPAMLNDAVEKLFEDNPLLGPNADISRDDTVRAVADFENNTEFLCRAASGYSAMAKGRRSTLCYSLNAKRGSNARIPTPLQFDAVSKVFAAILSGCSDDEGGVSSAKMCMMLAQTFYTEKPEELDSQDAIDVSNQSARKARRRRVYVKSKLADHKIWSKDDFW